LLEHDPEKHALAKAGVDTGFRKRSCSTNDVERDDDSKISHPALAVVVAEALVVAAAEVEHFHEVADGRHVARDVRVIVPIGDVSAFAG
jgi:hypothetical protein